MSIKEASKTKENLLSNQIKRELNLLPKIIREKKIEIDSSKREIVILKEKYSFFHKEFEKISFNIMSLEKDYSLLLIKNDSLKTQQKILLNSINNETPFDFKNFFKKNTGLQEIFQIFLNFEKNYTVQLSLILENNNELTTLLIGSYSYLKMLQNDFVQKYKEFKNKINNALNNIKEIDEDSNLFYLVINYIKNVFMLLDNKDTCNGYEKKIENYIEKKNEIFIKLKILEEKKKEKENNLNIIDNYMNEIISVLEKYKLYSKYSKTKVINSTRDKENKINMNKSENNSGNNLNISCPNNPFFKKDNKNLYNNHNEVRNTNNKISYINIDLTNIYIEKDKINNKKTIDSVDDINSKINNSNSILKRINISNYKNIKDLEKDIYGHLLDLKNNPLYTIKLNIGNNSTNNNNIINININNSSNNNKSIISKNKKLKKNITKNNDIIKNKSSSNKSDGKNKIEKKDKNITQENNSNNIIINQTNTTMAYNNILINNSNEMNKSNISNDQINKTTKINHYTSSNYIKKSSPVQKEPKKIPQSLIHKPLKTKLIPYLPQECQISKDPQRKSSQSNFRKKTKNKEQKNTTNNLSPLASPQKSKKIMNINNTNNKIASPFTNLENTNCNTEKITDIEKKNQSSYSKISKKNIYMNIKHNKTNLCKENLNEKNNKEKRNKKSLNKIKVNISKKEIKTVNNSEQYIEKKNSPNKQSLSVLLNILNSEENNNNSNSNNKNIVNEKLKNKEITKINIDLDKCKNKNKSPMFKQRQYFDKYNKNNIKEINIENNEINNNKNININITNINTNTHNNTNININTNMNNSLSLNKNNCHIIPFKKNKNKNNTNNTSDKKINSKNIKDNKTLKTNRNFTSNNFGDKNRIEEKNNISEIRYNNNNSQFVNDIIKKEISNYSFNKQDYKSIKKSYIQI